MTLETFSYAIKKLSGINLLKSSFPDRIILSENPFTSRIVFMTFHAFVVELANAPILKANVAAVNPNCIKVAFVCLSPCSIIHAHKIPGITTV